MSTISDSSSPLLLTSAVVTDARRWHDARDPSSRTAGEALLWVELATTPPGAPLDPTLREVLFSHYRALLRTHLRSADSLTRVGMNHIGIICPGFSDWRLLSGLLSRLLQVANPPLPLPLPGNDGYCTISITAVLVADAAKHLRSLQEPATD